MLLLLLAKQCKGSRSTTCTSDTEKKKTQHINSSITSEKNSTSTTGSRVTTSDEGHRFRSFQLSSLRYTSECSMIATHPSFHMIPKPIHIYHAKSEQVPRPTSTWAPWSPSSRTIFRSLRAFLSRNQGSAADKSKVVLYAPCVRQATPKMTAACRVGRVRYCARTACLTCHTEMLLVSLSRYLFS